MVAMRLECAARRLITPCGEGTMAWREWGVGPAVVLLHGGFGSWLHWIRNIEPLAADYRVLAGDLPGLRDSALPPVADDPSAIGRIVASGIEALVPEPEPCHLVGFSFGGMIGGHVAAALGSRARTLTLVGASGLGIAREPVSLIRRTPGMSEPARLDARRHNVKALMVHRAESVDALAIAIQAHNDVRARLKSRRLSLGDSLKRVLPQVAASLNGVWGEHDATAVPRNPRAAHAARGVASGDRLSGHRERRTLGSVRGERPVRSGFERASRARLRLI